MFNQLTFKTMKKTFLTLLFAGVMTFSAFGHQKVKTFPTLERTKAKAPAKVEAPSYAPSGIDDKALGTKIYATQIEDESKMRSWLNFNTSNPGKLNRIREFENAIGEQQYGLFLGCWGGDKYYGYYGIANLNSNNPAFEWRGFQDFVSLDVETGETTSIKNLRQGEDNATVVWYNRLGDQAFPVIQDMSYNPSDNKVYAMAKYQKDENTDAVSILYTIDKETGELSEVKRFQDQILDFCFDYEGNMYAVAIYWTNAEGGGFQWSGTLLNKYDAEFEKVDGKQMRIKDMDKKNVLVNGYGSLSFDYTTGDLYLASCIAPTDGSSNYDRFVKLDPKTGKYADYPQSFNSGNMIVGMYIPYFEADNRDAAGRVTDLTATPNPQGATDITLAWKNPTTTWAGDELKELANVQIYRKNASYTKGVTSSEELFANSKLIATVPATAESIGKEMTWKDTEPETGINTYYIVPCRVDGEKGVPDSIRAVAGADIPGVVTNFTAALDGENVKLTWEAPVDGKNNGYVDPASLKYDIVRNPGVKTVASDLAATTFTDEEVATVVRGKYTYTIVAKTPAGVSDAVVSNSVEAGIPPLPPVKFGTETEDEAGQWTAFENPMTADGNVWKYVVWDHTYQLYVNAGVGEDWTASPAFRMEKGRTYLFTSKFNNGWPDAGHTIGRYVGTTPTLEGMTEKIGEETEYSAPGYTNPIVTYEDKFTAPEDGTYYFGFRISDNTAYDTFNFYGVEIEPMFANDLKALDLEIFGGDVVSGNYNKCKAHIKNNGSETAEAGSYKVEVLQNIDGTETVVGSTEETPVVRAESTSDVTVEFMPQGEGDSNFSFRIVYSKDEFNGNNTSEAKKVNVIPFGDATPWSMVVTGDDEWNASYTPTCCVGGFSGSQSIYLKSDFAEKPSDSNTIERIGYEYNSNGFNDALPIGTFTVWMANSDLTEFTDASQWLDESSMTQVYSGPVTLYPGTGNMLSLQLDTPFEYDPTKSLVICAQQEGSVDPEFAALWRVFNWNGARNRSLRFWTPKSSRTFCEASAAALFVGFKQNLSGIQDVNGNAAGNVYYNAETGKLVLGGAQADVFDISGKLVRSYNGVSQVAPSLPAGMYVVKARTANGTQSVKVSVK